MTLSEFKAWFEGFTEGMDQAPTAKQWKRIQARVKEISGTPTSYPVFIDRYREYRPYWSGVVASPALPLYPYQVTCNSSAVAVAGAGGQVSNDIVRSAVAPGSFDSHAAMFAVGRADAEALAA
jgi:hypothetical protein